MTALISGGTDWLRAGVHAAQPIRTERAKTVRCLIPRLSLFAWSYHLLQLSPGWLWPSSFPMRQYAWVVRRPAAAFPSIGVTRCVRRMNSSMRCVGVVADTETSCPPTVVWVLAGCTSLTAAPKGEVRAISVLESGETALASWLRACISPNIPGAALAVTRAEFCCAIESRCDNVCVAPIIPLVDPFPAQFELGPL